jgi:hypothetical protein
MNQWGVHNLVLNITEDGPVRAETLKKKFIKVVGNKTIYNSYAQHGMKGIKILGSILGHDRFLLHHSR